MKNKKIKHSKISLIVAELQRLAASNYGILRPEDIVKAAESKSSVLHSRFTWNNDKAAHEHRLWQARQLISVSVQYIGPPENLHAAPVFVSLRSDRIQHGGGYRTVVSVMNDEELRAQLLHDAIEEMNVFQNKYANLQELVNVFHAMRRVKVGLQKPNRIQLNTRNGKLSKSATKKHQNPRRLVRV